MHDGIQNKDRPHARILYKVPTLIDKHWCKISSLMITAFLRILLLFELFTKQNASEITSLIINWNPVALKVLNNTSIQPAASQSKCSLNFEVVLLGA